MGLNIHWERKGLVMSCFNYTGAISLEQILECGDLGVDDSGSSDESEDEDLLFNNRSKRRRRTKKNASRGRAKKQKPNLIREDVDETLQIQPEVTIRDDP